MLVSDKVDDSDSAGNTSETVAPSVERDGDTMPPPPGVGQAVVAGKDNDFSYNLEMLGDVALHFPEGHQSLKGSETDMEVEGGRLQRSDEIGDDGRVCGVRCDSVVNSTYVGESGANSSRQVEKYALFSGMKVIVPSGTTDVIDDMLVCETGVSKNDVMKTRSSLPAGHSNSSQTDGGDSDVTETYTVLDLSQSLR